MREAEASDPMLLFGRAMRAVLDGRRIPLRFEHDSGDVATVDAGAFVRPFLFPDIERALLSHLEERIVPGGRIFDVGCGSGRHARYLGARGFAVEGVEASPMVSDLARSLGTHVSTASVWTFHPEAPAQAVLLLGNSIGLCEEVTFLKPLFKRLAQLAPLVVLDSAELGDASKAVRGRFSYEGRFGAPFTWLHPSRADVVAAAVASGFAIDWETSGQGGRYGLVLSHPCEEVSAGPGSLGSSGPRKPSLSIA